MHLQANRCEITYYVRALQFRAHMVQGDRYRVASIGLDARKTLREEAPYTQDLD
jgi:glycine cleavage system aminomethyltransferase T